MSKPETKVTIENKDIENIDLGHYEDYANTTETDKENDMLEREEYEERYAEFGEEFEEEPMFEKTNRQKGVRRVRD